MLLTRLDTKKWRVFKYFLFIKCYSGKLNIKCTFIMSLPFYNDNKSTIYTHKQVKFLVIQLCQSTLLSQSTTGRDSYKSSCHVNTIYLHFINKNTVFNGRSPLLRFKLGTQQCDMTALLATYRCC